MIATCIKTDPFKILEVGREYEIEQYKDIFIVSDGLALGKEVFNELFKMKGGEQ